MKMTKILVVFVYILFLMLPIYWFGITGTSIPLLMY